MTTTNSLVHTLPLRLYDGQAVRVDTKVGFKLKLHETNPEAPPSPIYLNIRTPNNPKPGPLTPEIVKEIGCALWWYAKKTGIHFDAIAGLPNAGIPIAQAFKDAVYEDGVLIPLIQLGKTSTNETRKIDGVIDTDGASLGDTVLVIDDLITAGDSKNEGIEALRKAGFKVTDVLVLVDREQGGAVDLAKREVRLHSLLTLRSLVNMLFEANRISHEERERVLTYLAH